MQPVKLTIPGKFWDTQLYSGVLFVFTQDGWLLTASWDSLVDNIHVQENLKFVRDCALLNSGRLYGTEFLLDSDFRHLLKEKLSLLSSFDLEVPNDSFQKNLIGSLKNPFPFPHSDSFIYRNTFYSVGKHGIFEAACHKRLKYRIKKKSEKIWDAPVFSGSASYGNLALAAGDNGLFEMPVDDYSDRYKDPKRRSGINCHECKWAYYDIYCSSHLNSGFLTHYSSKDHFSNLEEEPVSIQELRAESIFSGSGYSWGTRDKLYLAKDSKVTVVKFDPWKKEWNRNEDLFQRIGEVELQPWKGQVVSAATTVFGIVIECENALVIWHSDNSFFTIQGEPINWRVFPRSKFYDNQLHVIFDDRLEIYSFNHDYFENQETKKLGIAYRK